jgi:hypothetical protein
MMYVQLLTGITTLFLNADYEQFKGWIEPGWLTSVWEFFNLTHLTFQITSHWTPMLSREHDRALMEEFISQKLHPVILGSINFCRVYLQVITISNIFSHWHSGTA